MDGGASVPGSMLVTPNVGNGTSRGCKSAAGEAVCAQGGVGKSSLTQSGKVHPQRS